MERTAIGSGFHNWGAKAMSSSRGAKLILSYERLTGGGLTWPFIRNLEIYRSTVLSQMPKKNETFAPEFWRIWTNHTTRYRWSAQHGADIMEEYFLLILLNINRKYSSMMPAPYSSFLSCNRRSIIDIRELKQPRRRRQQNPTNLRIWQWKTVFLRALHVHSSSFDILKTLSFFLRREMTCFAIHVQYCQLDSIGKNRSSIRPIYSIWRIENFLDDPTSRLFHLPFASH